MSTLVRYEAARAALAEAHRVDEVKDIHDKAHAIAAYARQANDTAMVEWATEIKVRAERRAGELLHDMEKNPGSLSRGTSRVPRVETRLSDLGINKKQSSRWQKLAAVPEKQFEEAVEAAKEVAREVTTTAVLRHVAPSTNGSAPTRHRDPEKIVDGAKGRIWEAFKTADELQRETILYVIRQLALTLENYDKSHPIRRKRA